MAQVSSQNEQQIRPRFITYLRVPPAPKRQLMHSTVRPTLWMRATQHRETQWLPIIPDELESVRNSLEPAGQPNCKSHQLAHTAHRPRPARKPRREAFFVMLRRDLSKTECLQLAMMRHRSTWSNFFSKCAATMRCSRPINNPSLR